MEFWEDGVSRLDYQVADGSRLQLIASTPIGPTSGYVAFRMPNLGFRNANFVIGPIGYADRVAADPDITLTFEWVEEYEYTGGTLRLGTGLQPGSGIPGDTYLEREGDGVARPTNVLIGIWEGDHHGVHLIRYGRGVGMLFEAFGLLELEDAPEGTVVRPHRLDEAFVVEGPGVIADIPEIGIVEIVELTARSNANLPKHAGTKVLGGDLYISEKGENGPQSFLLIGETAVAHIQPHGHVHPEGPLDHAHGSPGLSESDLLELIGRLELTWTRYNE